MNMVWATLCAVALVGVALQWWILAQVRSQQTRVLSRVDAAQQRLTSFIARPVNAPVAAQSAPTGAIAPRFTLPTLRNNQISLDQLLARGKPVALFFGDALCGPCEEMLPQVGRWQRDLADHLTLAVITAGLVDENRRLAALHHVGLTLVQQRHEMIEAYKLEQAPALVIIAPDGTLQGETAYGDAAITRAVQNLAGNQVFAAQSGSLTNASVMPVFGRMLDVGDTVSLDGAYDLDGNAVVPALTPGNPTALLFWSPFCSHCRTIAELVRSWEAAGNLAATNLIIISKGLEVSNRAAGFRSPMILDDNRNLNEALNIEATPSLVLLDSEHRVISGPARGATAVRAYFDQARTSTLSA